MTPKAVIDARADMVAVLRKYEGKLSGHEMLALVCYVAGMMVLQQDQRCLTKERLREIVEVMLAGLEEGKRDTVEAILRTEGHA